MNVTLTLEQYQSLATLARGTSNAARRREVDAFLRTIETANNIKRYFLWVQWQETDSALPPTARFPDTWPPELRLSIERTDRAISRADVDKVLSTRAKKPVTILVTTDPGGELGWTPIADYFRG